MIEKHEPFDKLRTDMTFARACFRKYITWLYLDYSGRDWTVAATRWNVGPHGSLGRGMGYRYAVQKAGK